MAAAMENMLDRNISLVTHLPHSFSILHQEKVGLRGPNWFDAVEGWWWHTVLKVCGCVDHKGQWGGQFSWTH